MGIKCVFYYKYISIISITIYIDAYNGDEWQTKGNAIHVEGGQIVVIKGQLYTL